MGFWRHGLEGKSEINVSRFLEVVLEYAIILGGIWKKELR